MIQLRKYQQKVIDEIKSFFSKKGKHILIQAPTGAGKTVIFSVISKSVADKNKKVLIMTDRVELLTQTGGTLQKVGISTYNISAGINHYNKNYNVYIAMSQTLRRRIKLDYWQKFIQDIDLIIIDEAHKQEFNYLFENELLKDKYVIGFTATPIRSGKMRQLGLDYEYIYESVDVQWLIDHDFLVDAQLFSLADIQDFENIQIDKSKGDYKTSAMFEKFNSTKLYSGVVENWKKFTPKTKTLVFCVNISHTIMTALEFEKNGISVKYIVSNVNKPKVPKIDSNAKKQKYLDELEKYELCQSTFERLSGVREEIFEQHKKGDYQVLVNAAIATTGYDDPTLQTIILNRATLSTGLFLQMIGRGSRISPNKTHFNILDFGANIQRLGTYSQPREWNLWHNESKPNGVPPLKKCGHTPQNEQLQGIGFIEEGCRRLILASYSICPFCGFKYPQKKAKKVELKIITPKRSTKTMHVNELYEYTKERGYKISWFWRQLYYRGGKQEIQNFGKKNNWSSSTISKALRYVSNF